ncbi:MAG: hypothetical protein AB7P03_30170 [Kofleriaceae bacterium]
MSKLPPCGLYRTVKPIGTIESGRLVYFHNHGDPGPGVYLPDGWSHNRAHFAPNGMTIATDFEASALRALPPEGFYRVKAEFFCCAKQCVRYEPDQLVQLGYNGAGKPLLFLPELSAGAITVPQRGAMIDDESLGNLVLLKLSEAQRRDDLALPRGIIVH